MLWLTIKSGRIDNLDSLSNYAQMKSKTDLIVFLELISLLYYAFRNLCGNGVNIGFPVPESLF